MCSWGPYADEVFSAVNMKRMLSALVLVALVGTAVSSAPKKSSSTGIWLGQIGSGDVIDATIINSVLENSYSKPNIYDESAGLMRLGIGYPPDFEEDSRCKSVSVGVQVNGDQISCELGALTLKKVGDDTVRMILRFHGDTEDDEQIRLEIPMTTLPAEEDNPEYKKKNVFDFTGIPGGLFYVMSAELVQIRFDWLKELVEHGVVRVSEPLYVDGEETIPAIAQAEVFETRPIRFTKGAMKALLSIF